jgi:hypothetical protein
MSFATAGSFSSAIFSTTKNTTAKIVRMRVCLTRAASLLNIVLTLPDPSFLGWKMRSWRASSSLLNVRHPTSALNALPVRLLQCSQYMRLQR